jgi:hypothetical protein
VHVSDTGGVLGAVFGVVVPRFVGVLVAAVVSAATNVLVAITEVVARESEVLDVASLSPEEIERSGVLLASDVTV